MHVLPLRDEEMSLSISPTFLIEIQIPYKYMQEYAHIYANTHRCVFENIIMLSNTYNRQIPTNITHFLSHTNTHKDSS